MCAAARHAGKLKQNYSREVLLIKNNIYSGFLGSEQHTITSQASNVTMESFRFVDETADEVTSLRPRNWTGVCDDPGTPAHMQQLVRGPSKVKFTPGASVRYACSSGEYLLGANVLRCLEFGNWSEDLPSCVSTHLVHINQSINHITKSKQ